MPFDPFQYVSRLEEISPSITRKAAMAALNLVSPFNAHLHLKLLLWSDSQSEILLKLHRSVKNHVGSIHAGAQFTLGETCAGVIIVRNFPFQSYRPLMSDVKVSYTKQARGSIIGRCELALARVEKAKKDLKNGIIPKLEMETKIYNDKEEVITVVTTLWQVKPWQQVRPKK